MDIASLIEIRDKAHTELRLPYPSNGTGHATVFLLAEIAIRLATLQEAVDMLQEKAREEEVGE